MVVPAGGGGDSPAGLGTWTCLFRAVRRACWRRRSAGRSWPGSLPGPRRLGMGAGLLWFVPWRGPRLGLSGGFQAHQYVLFKFAFL